MRKKIALFFILCLTAVFMTGCSMVPYDYMNNWVIRQNATPRYFADYDVIYIYPTMFENKEFPIMNWSKPPLAQDVCDYIKTITMDRFGNKVRFFAPFVHQLEYNRFYAMLPSLPLDDYSQSLLEPGIYDTALALKYYFDHFHEKQRPFILIGHEQGAIDLYEAMKRVSDIKPENGFVAAYFVGIPRLTKQQIIDDFSSRGILPATGEFDTGVIAAWNPILPSEKMPAFSNAESFIINPLNWKTDSTPASFEEDLTTVIYYFDHPDILARVYNKKNYAGATINPINGTLLIHVKPDPKLITYLKEQYRKAIMPFVNNNPRFTYKPQDRMEETIFRSNRYGLFVDNVALNAKKRVMQYLHKVRWDNAKSNQDQ